MKIKKIIITFLVSIFLIPNFSFASTTPDSISGRSRSQVAVFQSEANFSSAPAENIIATIIKTALSLLGILFIILMIYSGYQWMTAGGNEDTVKKSRSRIINAVIGLVIIVLAYSITTFVFRSLPGGPSGANSGAGGTGEIVSPAN